ncbi:MAG: DegT/DnrJ/EryC1/StrS family aminotransferase [Candidatus Acidiferrales bacterium]
MATNLGKIAVIVFLLVVPLGQVAVRNIALGQDHVSPPKQSAATPQGSTQSYNQRLEELTRDNAGAESSGVTGDYRIGAEDLLEVSVYGASDLDRTVRVSADGWISLPLAGDVQAEGLTVRELESAIEGLLQKNYMTHPQVNVFLQEMQSHPISVFGAVGKPGVFQIRGARSLIEVLSMAQGLADDAGNSVIVMRYGGVAGPASPRSPDPQPVDAAIPPGESAKPGSFASASGSEAGGLQINLKDLLMSADPRYNVMVYPGDVVKVPPAGIVYVVGQVRKPGGFVLKTDQNLSVLQALALAEGTTSTSAGKSARIIRTDGQSGKREEIAVNLNRILAGKDIDPVLQSKDILFVPNSAGKTAFYRGAEAAVSITGGLIVYPFKMLGGFGDGGAVTTNAADFARTIRWLRYNGEDRKTGEYHYHGETALLDNVQAAVLDIKLKYLQTWIEHRRKLAALYSEGLSGIAELHLPHFDESKQRDVFQNYVIRADARNRLKSHLENDGIETLVHWPKPMWRHRGLLLRDPRLTKTEVLCREVLSLPISAETTEEQVEIVVESIRSFYVPVRVRSARCA